MSDLSFKLEAASALGGYQREFVAVTIREVSDKALVSIAEPLNGAGPLNKKLKSAYGTVKPNVGKSTTSKDGKLQFLGLQSDMTLALFDHPGGLADKAIKAVLGDVGYYTDQSDAWVMIEISGIGSIAALERICPLNLAQDAFMKGDVARTVMEHLGVIIMRQSMDQFFLASAVSSADSLLHALVLSVENTIE